MSRRYRGYDEWLLDEHGEESCLKKTPFGPVKQSTLDKVDAAAAELRFRDEQWQANRERIFQGWKEKKHTPTLARALDLWCEQIRSGK